MMIFYFFRLFSASLPCLCVEFGSKRAAAILPCLSPADGRPFGRVCRERGNLEISSAHRRTRIQGKLALSFRIPSGNRIQHTGAWLTPYAMLLNIKPVSLHNTQAFRKSKHNR